MAASRHGYRYVAHTADVKFIATGSSISAAFRNAALAMFNTAADLKILRGQAGKETAISVNVSAEDYDGLLWMMLQHCLSSSEARGLFCYGISIPAITSRGGKLRLKARAACKAKSPEASKLEVKGVSKYDLSVSKVRGGVRATAVLDV